MVFGTTYFTPETYTPKGQQGFPTTIEPEANRSDEAIIPFPVRGNLVSVKLIDIRDRSNPKLLKSVDIEGSYLTSRMVGTDVYFVINSYPAFRTPQPLVIDLIPGFRELWRTVVMPEIVFFALALAAFELVVGILIIGKGTPVKYGLAASILFNLFLVQLGLAGQTADWVSDLLVNRLPNLVFIAIQIPLLFCTFERSLFEVLAGKWKNRAIQ